MSRSDRLAEVGAKLAIRLATVRLEAEAFNRKAKPNKKEMFHDFLARIRPETQRLSRNIEILQKRLKAVRLARGMPL